MRISDWSSDVCSSDLTGALAADAVVGDEAADRHARAILQQRQHRGGDIAADVLDIDVDAVRAGRRELRGVVRGLVVDAGIEAERSDGGALVGAAGDADHASTEDLAELSGGRASSEARRGGQECVSTCRSREVPDPS